MKDQGGLGDFYFFTMTAGRIRCFEGDMRCFSYGLWNIENLSDVGQVAGQSSPTLTCLCIMRFGPEAIYHILILIQRSNRRELLSGKSCPSNVEAMMTFACSSKSPPTGNATPIVVDKVIR